jgi:CDP-diglyceride synthetase
MNNLTQRLLTALFLTISMISLVLFKNTWVLFLFLVGGHMEFIWMLYHGDKLSVRDCLIISVGFLGWYLKAPYIGMIVLSNDCLNSLIYFFGCILWTYPSYLIAVEYVLSDPVFYIIAGTAIFLTDGGAYFGGKALGRTKLSSISPNKTIEGTVIGVLTSMVFMFLVSLIDARFTLGDWVILGLIYGVFGQMGDLVESALKRWVNVKDSGFLLPGMGGINDRCDSMYLALPVGHIYLMLRGYF